MGRLKVAVRNTLSLYMPRSEKHVSYGALDQKIRVVVTCVKSHNVILIGVGGRLSKRISAPERMKTHVDMNTHVGINPLLA